MTFEDFGSDLIGFSADNMDISPDGQYVVTNGCEEEDTNGSCFAHVWEISTGIEIARMDHNGPVTSVAFSPDGKYVASGSDDKTVRVWEAMTGKEIAHLIHDDWVFSIGFSPDGKNVVSGSCVSSTFTYGCQEAFVSVWEIANQKMIYQKTVDGNAMVVTYSPDGEYIVAGTFSEQPAVFVWDARTGRDVSQMIHDGSGSIYSLAFSLDLDNNLYILSTGCDQNISITSNNTCQKGSARVWEASTGREIARINHDGDVFTGVFSPDGTFVASGGRDGVTYFWKWRTKDLIAKACTHLTRNLTYDEWKQYIGNTMDYKAVCPGLPADNTVSSTQQ